MGDVALVVGGLVVGFLFGVVFMAMFTAAKWGDEHLG